MKIRTALAALTAALTVVAVTATQAAAHFSPPFPTY
ncbi:hypothetical protein OV450_5832 [Actinobacteria bacterium OV450]|nr:hypothetical protein OV450_5832 [Actinobacteria bacterium OV450]